MKIARVLFAWILRRHPEISAGVILFYILGVLTLVSAALTGWQWLGGRRFRLHGNDWNPRFTPPLTLLKPLKGCEPQTRRCLESWLEQDYPGEVQVLFGVDSADDPACAPVRELIAKWQPGRARLIVCKPVAPHPKTSKLIQLLEHAEHEVIAVSDADVRVGPDYLRHAVSFLEEPGVGLVNSFYRFENARGLAMACMALNVNADFWTQVLQGIALKPQDFALGAVMITRRSVLECIGGFESFQDYLADDYQLGNRIARAGKKIALTSQVAECRLEPQGIKAVWRHQLRQARTIRFCQGVPFFFSILGNATVWPLAWLAAFPGAATLAALAGCVIWRMGTARSNGAKLFPPGTPGQCRWWLAPVKDLAYLAVWAASFLGNEVEWRGQRFRVGRGGRLR